MGSWTGKYDPLRQVSVAAKKTLGFDPSPASRIHMALTDKSHQAADNYLNQETEGPGVKRKSSQRLADYSSAVSTARTRADSARRLTIMRSI